MTRLMRTGANAPSSSQLLARILERPELVAVVDKLSAPVLGQLIAHVGLEDAGELVAVASTQQLERVWDRDLWTRPEQGGAERFDPERFALWLAVMLEAGEAQTVARLRELPFDLLTLAVHRLVRVVEHEIWLAYGEDEDDEGEGGPHMPWQELVLIGRDEDAWDSLLRALLALDEEDHALLRRVLERCRDLDDQLAYLELEPDEIYTALTWDAALENDVAAERDERQGAAGYLSAADAQSFLQLARSGPQARAAQLARDPVAHAYFRELASAVPPAGAGDDAEDIDADDGDDDDDDDEHSEGERSRDALPVEHAAGSAAQAGSRGDEDHGDEQSALAALLGLLAESGVLAPRAAPIAELAAHATPADAELLGGEPEPAPAPAASEPAAAPASDESLLQAALRALEREQPELWSQRMEELGFLANAVLASGRDGGRAFDPRAALEACSALCSLGLELELPAKQRAQVGAAREVLGRVPADALFRIAAARAFHELALPARELLQQRCARFAALRLPDLRAALGSDELGDWPDELDGELLRMTAARFEALRGLAEAIPRLGGALAAGSTRYLTSVVQLQAGKRLLRALRRTRPG